MDNYRNIEICKVLENKLLETAQAKNILGEQFLIVEELDEVWDKCAAEYMADAIPEIPNYPTVAIAWACYFGIGAAALWEIDWNQYKDNPNLYLLIRDKRGFDYMDEYVTEELLISKGEEHNTLEVKSDLFTQIIADFSNVALNLFRKEGIEPQSRDAFYLFADFTKLFFRLGVSLQLHRLGYKYQKVQFS